MRGGPSPYLSCYRPMSDKLKTFFARLFSTVILLGLLGGAVYWNTPAGYGILICLMCNLTSMEWFRMLKGTTACRKLALGAGLLCPWLMFATHMVHMNREYIIYHDAPGSSPLFALLLLYILLAFFVNLFQMDYRGRSGHEALESMGLTLVAFVFPVWMFSFGISALDAESSIPVLLWLVLFTKMTDIWAYVCGVLTGRKLFKAPFSPAVSPKKSWEGIVGSYVISLTAGYFLWGWIIGPVEKDMPLWGYVIMASILFALSVTGDLAGSLIKRGLAVKDSGSLLPGIGGIFDLIDSPAFTVSVAFGFCPLLGACVGPFLS